MQKLSIKGLALGLEPTLAGSFIGLGWAFLDGLIGGAVLAWLYNKLSGAN